MTIVRHIALFRKFGARRPVAAEADYIAQLAGRIDPTITKGALDLAVDKLAERRIPQGSHTLRLVPRALHVHPLEAMVANPWFQSRPAAPSWTDARDPTQVVSGHDDLLKWRSVRSSGHQRCIECRAMGHLPPGIRRYQ